MWTKSLVAFKKVFRPKYVRKLKSRGKTFFKYIVKTKLPIHIIFNYQQLFRNGFACGF
jgi:hypothetical protein